MFTVELHTHEGYVFSKSFSEHATAKRAYDKHALNASVGDKTCSYSALRLWGPHKTLMLGTDCKGSMQL